MGEEVEERGNWSGKLDFLLSAIGYAVGLGNVWRFPYLAYRNGGASFLLPYIVMLFVAGLPLFFIELALGQFASEGPITVWKMAPLFTGIGYAMCIISAVVSIYYNVIIAYAVYYMFVSFVSMDDELPWEGCQHEWNTPACRDTAWPKLSDAKYNETERESLLWSDLYMKDCVENKFIKSVYKDYVPVTGLSTMYSKFWSGLMHKYPNITSFADLSWKEVKGYDGFSSCKYSYTSASEEYFERYVLQQHKSDDIGDLGDISLKLCLTLFLSWVLIFGCLMKGIKTSGKVVYFTATFPYVILIVLLIRGLTLEGYEKGIEFYVIPDWNKVTDAKIWNDAATQIFYSLGIGFGGLLTMASYNKFNNNCYRDAIMVALINCGTSIFAGFAIFSLLGHMAYLTNQEVADVATSGPGLAFVAYPDGISRLPASPVWAFLFFFMILTLGMDSQFAMMETVISGVSDIFPNTLRKNKTPFTFLCCIIGFALGIPQATHGGIRVLTLMNDYSGSYNLMVVALFELICLCYVYGEFPGHRLISLDILSYEIKVYTSRYSSLPKSRRLEDASGINNFRDDLKMMIGFRPKIYWMATWCAITPAAIIFIIAVSAYQYVPSSYDGQQFPGWAEGLGWLMVGFPIFIMFLVGAIQLHRYGWPGCIKPTPDWGPSQPEDRVGRYAAVNAAFQDDNGMALPYTVESKSAPPPSYNGNSNDTGKRYEVSESARL